MDVLMPQLGETVAEGKITKWFKSAGDAVKPGDNLFEIETDKVSMEVPSITAGTLTEIKVQAGETALVGAVVAVIAGEGGATASARQRLAPAPARPQAPVLRREAASRQGRPAGFPLAIGTAECAAKTPYADPLDPFFEVRTPARNFGPAKTAGGTSSRRWRAGSPARTASICRRVGLRPARPHRRARCRGAIARQGGRPAPMARPGPSADQVKALYPGRRVRGSAARRHARDHRARGWSRPSRPSRISI